MPTLKNKNTLQFHIKGPAGMRRWGKDFARLLLPGDVIAFNGPMGAGKTTCMQGLARGWDAKREVSSPTFALVNEYPSPRGTLYHMDLYRLKPNEITLFELEDYCDVSGLCVIEWADRAKRRLPKQTLIATFSVISKTERHISLIPPTRAWRDRLACWGTR